MVNRKNLTLQFTSLEKLADYVRASQVTSYELNITRMTLVAAFGGREISLALTYGAQVLEACSYQPSATKENTH